MRSTADEEEADEDDVAGEFAFQSLQPVLEIR